MKAKAFVGKGKMTEAEIAADTKCPQELPFGHSDAVPLRAPSSELAPYGSKTAIAQATAVFSSALRGSSSPGQTRLAGLCPGTFYTVTPTGVAVLLIEFFQQAII
jgi:hypothetical protein